MTLETARSTILDLENYPLFFSREKEIAQVREALGVSPIVFVWAPSENGKTGFGREFRLSVPHSSLILSVQLHDPDFRHRRPYDPEVNPASHIVVVDEFDENEPRAYAKVRELMNQGKQLILLMHHPKSHFLKGKHAEMAQLIADFPNALWIRLPKWKPKNQNKKASH